MGIEERRLDLRKKSVQTARHVKHAANMSVWKLKSEKLERKKDRKEQEKDQESANYIRGSYDQKEKEI